MFSPTPWSLAVLPSTYRLGWRESCFLTGTMLLLHVTKYILWPKLSISEGGTGILISVVMTSNKEKP